jgi:hypothetical protein
MGRQDQAIEDRAAQLYSALHPEGPDWEDLSDEDKESWLEQAEREVFHP